MPTETKPILTDEQRDALVELASHYLNSKPRGVLFNPTTRAITTPEGFVKKTLALFGVEVTVRNAEPKKPKRTAKKPTTRSDHE